MYRSGKLLIVGYDSRPDATFGSVLYGTVSAFDAASGAFQWKQNIVTADPETTSFDIDGAGQDLLVSSLSDPRNGSQRRTALTSFKIRTGAINWQILEDNTLATNLSIANGLAYLSGYGMAPSLHSFLAAYNLSTGQQVWRAIDQPSRVVLNADASETGVTVVGSSFVARYDALTGQSLWSKSLSLLLSRTLSIGNQIVVAGIQPPSDPFAIPPILLQMYNPDGNMVSEFQPERQIGGRFSILAWDPSHIVLGGTTSSGATIQVYALQ